MTRPDIAYPVTVVSQFMSSPRVTHWHEVVQILKYLKKARGGVEWDHDDRHTTVTDFSDADWAVCPFDRNSTTGYCDFVGGNLVSWKSKNSLCCQDLVQNQNIKLWPRLHVY